MFFVNNILKIKKYNLSSKIYINNYNSKTRKKLLGKHIFLYLLLFYKNFVIIFHFYKYFSK